MSKISHKNYVAIAKGIAIILMVIGHSGCPEVVRKTIYLFHMPFFFICSGLFFSPQNEIDKLRIFIIRKIKGIYLPFIKWCLPFILLHNVFYSINLYNNQFGFNGVVSHPFTMGELFRNVFYNIVKMDGIPQLLGGFWFIKDLFFATLFISGIMFIVNKATKQVRIAIFIFLFVGSMFFNYVPVGFYFITARDLFWSSAFLYSGYLLRSIQPTNYIYVLCSLVFVGGFLFPCYLDFFSGGVLMPIFYLTSIAGTILTLKLSQLLERIEFMRNFLYYVGNHTLVILGLHFLVFKIVDLIIIYTESLPIAHLAEFPVIANHIGYSPVYASFGVLLPLAIYYVNDYFKEILKKGLCRADKKDQ